MTERFTLGPFSFLFISGRHAPPRPAGKAVGVPTPRGLASLASDVYFLRFERAKSQLARLLRKTSMYLGRALR
jgi:hypothetical protein